MALNCSMNSRPCRFVPTTNCPTTASRSSPNMPSTAWRRHPGRRIAQRAFPTSERPSRFAGRVARRQARRRSAQRPTCCCRRTSSRASHRNSPWCAGPSRPTCSSDPFERKAGRRRFIRLKQLGMPSKEDRPLRRRSEVTVERDFGSRQFRLHARPRPRSEHHWDARGGTGEDRRNRRPDGRSVRRIRHWLEERTAKIRAEEERRRANDEEPRSPAGPRRHI